MSDINSITGDRLDVQTFKEDNISTGVTPRRFCQAYETAIYTIRGANMVGVATVELEATSDGINYDVIDSQSLAANSFVQVQGDISGYIHARINIPANGGGTPDFSIFGVFERPRSPFLQIGGDTIISGSSGGGSSNIPDWATGLNYTVGEEVVYMAGIYTCLVAHTSTTFGADFISGYWQQLSGAASSLEDTLAVGNITGANNIIVSSGQVITTNGISETTASAGITMNHKVIHSDIQRLSTETGITADPVGTFASSYVLSKENNVVTTAANDSAGVKLPSTIGVGSVVHVHNETDKFIVIHPGSLSHKIGQLNTSVAYKLPAYTSVTFIGDTGTNWRVDGFPAGRITLTQGGVDDVKFADDAAITLVSSGAQIRFYGSPSNTIAFTTDNDTFATDYMYLSQGYTAIDSNNGGWAFTTDQENYLTEYLYAFNGFGIESYSPSSWRIFADTEIILSTPQVALLPAGGGAFRINITKETLTGVRTVNLPNSNLDFNAALGNAYTPSNVVTDRSYDADATTLDEVADVLGTLIGDLQSIGILA